MISECYSNKVFTDKNISARISDGYFVFSTINGVCVINFQRSSFNVDGYLSKYRCSQPLVLWMTPLQYNLGGAAGLDAAHDSECLFFSASSRTWQNHLGQTDFSGT